MASSGRLDGQSARAAGALMREEVELAAAAGFIAPELAAEFPGLRLDWVTVTVRMRQSPREIKARLRDLSSRWRGTNVVAMRTQAIPHAYRTFFRHIGLDPDVDRIPSERAGLHRLLHGHFQSRNLIEDARLIALVETGVPVWAIDADLLHPAGLGIRQTIDGDRLGSGDHAHYLPPGRLAVADPQCVHAVLFEPGVAPGHEAGSRTERVALFSVGVDGVPAIHIEEALWVCVEALSSE
jgi:DNA/RNA-binding domain of Phe-tRNA-synthetase-like protein